MQFLNIWDLVLTPIFLLILVTVAKKRHNKLYPKGHVLRPYFLRGLYVKFFGAIFISLIYQFYYGGGDTSYYYYYGKIINSSLSDSFVTWFKLITRQSEVTNPELYPYVSQIEWYTDPSSYAVCQTSAVLGLLNGTTYLPIALLFAYFSYTGIWAMYRTFVNIYPKLHKELAIAFLFIPSTFVWGSGIFKDTICMFGLGWLTFTTFRIFVNRDFSVKNLSMLVISFYIIAIVKLYILIAFLPAVALWLLLTYSSKVKTAGMRFLLSLGIIGITVPGFLFAANHFAVEMDRYSLENVAQTAATTRGWITITSGDEGSAYDLGEFDPSLGGMLKKFPQAVVVTLFRPFPWEARKVVVMLSALEALLFIYFTIQAFRKSGIKKTFKLIVKDPNLLFFVVFSIIFAFAVGISSYNFGALSRYKIPCLPFYAAFLVILIYHDKKEKPSFRPQVNKSKKAPTLA